MTNIYGYIRVSTKEQNEARQFDALSPYDIPGGNMYMDKQSGKDFLRPAWRSLIRRLKAGDLLIVKSIDRLGRNYDEILEQWRHITKDIGADVLIVDLPLLDTRAGRDLTGVFVSDLVLQILSYVAQAERENIRQRQAEGIAAAKARGISCGRPAKPLPLEFWQDVKKFQKGQMTMRRISERYGVSCNTIRARMRAKNGLQGH